MEAHDGDESLLVEGGSERSDAPAGDAEDPSAAAARLHPEWFYEMPDEPTVKDRVFYPYRSGSAFIARLKGNFGSKFVWMLFSAYFGVKGALFMFITLGQLPYYQKYLHVGGVEYQTYGTVAATPWAMKAFLGAISDAVPIYGYHKKYYIIGVAVLGGCAFLLLSLVRLQPGDHNIAAMMFFLASMELAVVDLLCEGKYAELMVTKPETGSDLVTWVWACYQTGTLMAAMIIGPVADNVSPTVLFFICIPLALQILWPACNNYLPEEQLPPERRGIRWDKLREQKEFFLLAVIMAAGALGLALVNLFAPLLAQLVYSLAISALLCGLGFRWLPPMLAKCNLYMFLQDVLYVQIQGAMDYYYTAPPECVPDGPHFDYTYYTTFAQVVGALAGWMGVVLFQTVLSKWHFRSCFWVTTAIRIVASFFDVAIIRRWNTAVGVSDKTSYMLGNAIVFQIVYMLNFMPAVVLTSKLCPKNMEATIYALLAGFQNFGQNVSRNIGTYLIISFGIKTEVPCNFDNLSTLVIISNMLLPLITIPLTFWLIPDALLTDTLLPEDSDSAPSKTEDSFELVAFTAAPASDPSTENDDDSYQVMMSRRNSLEIADDLQVSRAEARAVMTQEFRADDESQQRILESTGSSS